MKAYPKYHNSKIVEKTAVFAPLSQLYAQKQLPFSPYPGLFLSTAGQTLLFLFADFQITILTDTPENRTRQKMPFALSCVISALVALLPTLALSDSCLYHPKRKTPSLRDDLQFSSQLTNFMPL